MCFPKSHKVAVIQFEITICLRHHYYLFGTRRGRFGKLFQKKYILIALRLNVSHDIDV